MSMSEWSELSEERKYMENILINRFNFLLVFYSIVVATAMSTGGGSPFIIVTTLGGFICFFLGLTIYRAHAKQDLLFKELIARYEDHPAVWVHNECREKNALSVLFTVRWFVGILLPVFFVVTLGLAAVVEWATEDSILFPAEKSVVESASADDVSVKKEPLVEMQGANTADDSVAIDSSALDR